MAKRRVTEDDLLELMKEADRSDTVIREFFELDLENSTAFNPLLKAQDDVVIVGEGPVAQGFLGLNLDTVNRIVRKFRHWKYRRAKKRWPERPRVLAEGDSWFLYPLAEDIIQHLSDNYPVISLAGAGHEAEQMAAELEFKDEIRDEKPLVLLLSAGGNDILGKELQELFNDGLTTPGEGAERLLNSELFGARLDEVFNNYYPAMIHAARTVRPDLPILVHGYDYARPGEGLIQIWLKPQFIAKHITDKGDQQTVIRLMIDEVNRRVQVMADDHGLIYVNARGLVGDNWNDEIHPDGKGARRVAREFMRVLDELEHEWVG
jgi:lysophospholipase L1-like esterase